MVYSRELAKRFVSDYKLPIPIIKEEYFYYHLHLYEDDYSSYTKYVKLNQLIDEKYDGDQNKFLKTYYNIRGKIIQGILSNPAFEKFNKMDVNQFAIKNNPNIPKNTIYNEENVGKFFISVDLKKANFHTLRNIDKDIVFGTDRYEDFIGNFTDSDYVKNSKYTREVIFSKANPKRHITVEKYFITKIYYQIIEAFPKLNGKAVSLSNDEIVFNDDFLYYNDKWKCYKLRKVLEEICKENGFEVHIKFFSLSGYHLLFKDTKSVRSSFYVKDYIFTDSNFKLISVPLQYHSIVYKLYKGIPLCGIDYHFNYEGIDAMFCEDFEIEGIKK